MPKRRTLIMALWLACQPLAALAAETELPGVATKDLDAPERKILDQILQEQFDPCGKPRSFLDAVKDAKTCPLATRLANFCVEGIRRGLSKKQVVRSLLKELKRLTVKYDFTLDGRPAYGPKDARVTVVEFSDFECPYCRKAAAALRALVGRHKGVRLVFKHYPLEFHKTARVAAIACTAAHQQGKFWQLHDLLFKEQGNLTPALVEKLAKAAGLDMARFAKDLKAAETVVDVDRREGDAAGVDGTPTLYVNGLKVEMDDLEKRLEEELGKK